MRTDTKTKDNVTLTVMVAVQFRVIDRNGRTPPPLETGYKDTVIVDPREQVRLLLRFEEHTDPDLPYMYHCHILEHEDAGMMGQFVVVDS